MYPSDDDQPKIASWQPDYFLEGIDYLVMPADVDPSEEDRRALAAVNLECKIGKRKKLSERKDAQELSKEMDPASCGLPCQTAPVAHEVL